MADHHTRTVRVTSHVLAYLCSQVTAPAYKPTAQVAAKCQRGRQGAGGGRAVELTAAERHVLRGLAERMAAYARRRSLRPGAPAVGSLNAANALLRQLDKIEASEAMLDRLCAR